MNKAYVLAMVMIVVNLIFIWFGTMEFFTYQPTGIDVGYDTAKYGFSNLILDGFIATGLGLLAGLVSIFMRINAFAMIMFVEVFWFPFYKTSGIFYEVLKDAPAAFLGITGIFMTIMFFVFAYALIEMSSSTVVSG